MLHRLCFCIRILYRVLYEIVHVIKQANKIFMEGNEEQALMNYARSIEFFKTLRNEVQPYSLILPPLLSFSISST